MEIGGIMEKASFILSIIGVVLSIVGVIISSISLCKVSHIYTSINKNVSTNSNTGDLTSGKNTNIEQSINNK